MPNVRPMRNHEIFCSPCISCATDVESKTLPVPLYCNFCIIKQQEVIQKVIKEKRPVEVKTTNRLEEQFKYYEVCPVCQESRSGIADNRMYYKCGHILEFRITTRKRS